MKMKKLIAINLIMAGILLTACGKDGDVKDLTENPAAESTSEESTAEAEGTSEEKNDESAQNADTDGAAEADKEESTETSDGGNSEEVSLLLLNKDVKSVYYMDSETYDYYMQYEDERIVLAEDEAGNYPALAAALEAEVKDRNNTYQADIDALIEAYNEEKANGNNAGFELSNKMSVERADTVVLSVRDKASSYTGGAHGMYGDYGYNYDTQTGKVLKFSDVVSDPVAFLNLANDKIQESYSTDYETPATLDDYYEDYDTSIIWTIDYQGVRIYFSPYTLGSYALGSVETEIYFNEAPELFNPKYLNIPKSYVIELGILESSFIDIDNDGENEEIIITQTYDDEYTYVCGADIRVEGKIFSFDEALEQYYFVSDKGNNYIIVFASDESSLLTIKYIDLSTMKIDSVNETYGFLATLSGGWIDDDNRSEYSGTQALFTDPGKVMLSTYIWFLGSMTGNDYYHMSEAGFLVADTENYSIDMNSVLTAGIDIECELVDLDGNVTGTAVIPEGTRLVVRRGDGKTYADLIEVPADADVSEYDIFEYVNTPLNMEDADVIYRVKGELNEYGSQAVIGGQEEFLVFDGIIYGD